MELQLVKGLSPQFKNNYIRLIAAGAVESQALIVLEVDWLDFFEICSKDPQFRKDIEEARKNRADHWVDKIAVSIEKKYHFEGPEDPITKEVKIFERPPTKDELGRDKLDFEKLKFLAQADNPDKYAGGSKPKVNIEFDMKDFKLLSTQEAAKVLLADPFAKPTIDAEIVEDKKDG
jgi:hypothetical protein